MDQEQTAEVVAWLGLLRGSVEEILRAQDQRSFCGWMEREAPLRVPAAFAGLSAQQRCALVLTLVRGIWNEVPLPRNGFQPDPIPPPAPSAPCPCGSGKRYRFCCGLAPDLPPVAVEVVRGLAMLLSGGTPPMVSAGSEGDERKKKDEPEEREPRSAES
jgi:hypothetical protein